MTQETKKKYFDMESEVECPHCKKTFDVGFDYTVQINSPEDIYIELESGIQVVSHE